ncbi:hypothetical protein OAJ11_02155 [Candidatus Poseidoniales archaeon]|nr:hypothetical protein [Candidatus Poseidoniales archaeon]MDC0149897.1 hypothetical protein [Candidatus Poseidoniales archaeon]MDC0183519.1 hypothetical protein [Candidatus Poseidoniales archaeon]
MEMDWKTNMAELGGAFAVSWLVLGEGNAVMMGVLLAVVMAAMAGAHVLPMFTWISAMTGDLQDTDAWIGNVMRLVMQVVGAGLALAMVGEGTVDAAGLTDIVAGVDGAADTGGDEIVTMWAFDLWPMLMMVAAGALIGAIASRCDGWMTAFAVVAMAGALGAGVTGADTMAAEVMGSGNMVEAASTWVLDGVVIGVGALLGGMLEDQL